VQQGFRISDWRVEPQLNTLTGPDKTAHLEPKVMQVLLCLAEQAGQVIPKERLIQRVWPDTFVSDDVLTRSISELRRAFGDDAKEPRFIQTIPRGGYRLIARVFSTDVEQGIAAPSQAVHGETVRLHGYRSTAPLVGPRRARDRDEARAAAKRSFLRPWVAVAFLSLLVITVLVWVLWRYPVRRTGVIERKLTTNLSENSVTSMALSPDGRYLAYADNNGI